MNSIKQVRANFPAELLALPNWVVWMGKGGKKIPFNPHTGKGASSTDSATWGTFEQAADTLRRGGDRYNGLSFCFPLDGSLVGVDVDNKDGPQVLDILKETGAFPTPEMTDAVSILQGYTEISPSGTGLHIFIKASIPPGSPNRVGKVEIYERGRFFTVTGNRLPGSLRELHERQEELGRFYEVLQPKENKAKADLPVPVAGQVDALELHTRAAQDAKLRRLWAGDTSDYGGDESRVDFVLCLKLAFYTAGDRAAMDSLFRQSGLMRDKWDKVHVQGQTYGQATIKNALLKWDGKCWKEPERPAAPKQQKQEQDKNTGGCGGDTPKNFTMTVAGLYYTPEDSGGDSKTWVSPPFTITARTRNSLTGAGWGKLIEFTDPDGKAQQWAMPMRELAGTEYLKVLYDLGLEVSTYPACRALLSRYIREYSPAETLDCVERTGWHGEVFVLPDATIGGRRVILENPLPNNPYALGGSLECWQKQVAALCAGNSRLVFSVSCAFAAPLLGLVAEENGGFHFRGSSSEGKTVALRVAASVWGGADYLQRWRSTAVGIEQTAAQFNDTLLCLDEIGQVEPHVAGEIAYMLANGQGKLRGAKSGGLRKTDKWRLLFLSTGEISLAQHMKDGNKTTKAGQEIRLADIPSNAGKGLGLFEELHGQPGGADFAQYLSVRIAECHGQAGRAFIEALQKLGIERALRFLVKRRKAFEAHIPENAQGQAVRVARRFALVAATGELATVLRVTGWKRGEATKAAKRCMGDWLEARGGAGQRETRQALEQVLAFFELHGAARFTDWDRPETIIHNRAGYRRSVNEGIEYYVFPAVFKDEICKGLDYRQVAALLMQVGWLMAGIDRPYTRKERLPGIGNTWCLRFNPELELPGENSLGAVGAWGQNEQFIDNSIKKLPPSCPQSAPIAPIAPSSGNSPHLCSSAVLSFGGTTGVTGGKVGADIPMILSGKGDLPPCPQRPHTKNISPRENRQQDTEDLLGYLLYLDPSREGRVVELPEISESFAWKPGRLLAARRALEEAGELQLSINPRATPIKLAVKGGSHEQHL